MVLDAADILTKSAFAKKHGVDSSAVSKWIERGHLSGAALTVDGRINVAEAERQLGDRLDQSRSIGKIAAAAAIAAPVSAPIAAAGTLADIKRRQAELDLRRQLEQEEERRGRYVLVDAIRREHTRELVQLLATVEQRLPELVAQLAGIEGKAAVTAARRWWRSLRQAEATAAQSRAELAPKFDSDRPDSWPVTQEAAHAA